MAIKTSAGKRAFLRDSTANIPRNKRVRMYDTSADCPVEFDAERFLSRALQQEPIVPIKPKRPRVHIRPNVHNDRPSYTISLINVPEPCLQASKIQDYLVSKNFPLPASLTIRKKAGLVFIAYDSVDDYHTVADHEWEWGKLNHGWGYNPSSPSIGRFWRHMFQCSNNNAPNMEIRAAAALAKVGVHATSAGPSTSPSLLVVYCATRCDFIQVTRIRSNKGIVVVPPSGADPAFTLEPLPAMAATDEHDIYKLRVSGVPTQHSNSYVAEACRIVAIEEGGYHENDVLFFGRHIWADSHLPSTFGWLHVAGMELAEFLLNADIPSGVGKGRFIISQPGDRSEE